MVKKFRIVEAELEKFYKAGLRERVVAVLLSRREKGLDFVHLARYVGVPPGFVKQVLQELIAEGVVEEVT